MCGTDRVRYQIVHSKLKHESKIGKKKVAISIIINHPIWYLPNHMTNRIHAVTQTTSCHVLLYELIRSMNTYVYNITIYIYVYDDP